MSLRLGTAAEARLGGVSTDARLGQRQQAPVSRALSTLSALCIPLVGGPPVASEWRWSGHFHHQAFLPRPLALCFKKFGI